MNDLISRQAAIDIVQGYAERLYGHIGTPNDSETYAYARGLLLSIERNINALPSAQSEHGRWMYNEGETIEDGGYCSVCGCDQPMFF